MPKKTAKKTTKKKSKKKPDNDMTKQAVFRFLPEDLEWLDETAAAMHTSRQKLMHTVVRGMRLADEESNKQGTFFNMYTNHMASLIEDAASKKRHGR